jgi:hypothetical protein
MSAVVTSVHDAFNLSPDQLPPSAVLRSAAIFLVVFRGDGGASAIKSPGVAGKPQKARGKRLPARVQAVSVRRDASALINPDFYLIIAWFAEHFIAFAFFDVLFPFFIWNAEHFRPKLTALGTHIWIHDKWDAAFIV